MVKTKADMCIIFVVQTCLKIEYFDINREIIENGSTAKTINMSPVSTNNFQLNVFLYIPFCNQSFLPGSVLVRSCPVIVYLRFDPGEVRVRSLTYHGASPSGVSRLISAVLSMSSTSPSPKFGRLLDRIFQVALGKELT